MHAIFMFICIALIFPVSANAGDYAFEQVIGFSKDGRYFGFEEYGVEDGSGFPYSHIFVIDLETDTFAPATPIRVRIDDDKVSLSIARSRAKKKANGVLKKYALLAPAVVAYARGLGDFAGFTGGLSTPIASRITFFSHTDPTNKPVDFFDLVLTHIPAPSVANCPLDTIGFQMEKVDSNGRRRFVHRDEKIFRSRGCPLKYRISRVYLPGFDAGDFAAVLISVFQTGFEGPDRRFVVFPVLIK